MVLIALGLWLATVAPTSPQSLQPNRGQDIGPDEYEIYSAAIQRYYVQEKVEVFRTKKVKLLFVAHTTWPFQLGQGSDPTSRSFVEAIRAIAPPEAIADFNERNAAPASLENNFHVSVKCVLIDEKQEQELRDIMNTGRWRKRYPTSPGILSLTRIGFSPDRTKAIVGVGHTCGNMCGETKFALMVKDHGSWRFERWSSVSVIS